LFISADQGQFKNPVKAPLTNQAIEEAAIEGAVRRLRPKLVTVTAVVASLVPILWEDRRRLRCDETHRRADSWRHDHLRLSTS
jgi:hypothetical protein